MLERTLPEIIQNWGVSDGEIVLEDRLSGCHLPHGQVDGESVAEEELRWRPPSEGGDLEVSEGRTIPEAIVRQCLSASEDVALREMVFVARIRVVIERSAWIASNFRKNRNAWTTRHPRSIGVVSFGRPVYSKDGQTAAVSYSRFRNGIGGGVFFCLLQRANGRWGVLWQETVLIE